MASLHAPSRARRQVADQRSRARGQILIIFVAALVPLLGVVALVVDISWFWSSALRVQRAADAAALAGVVYLPGKVGTAVTAAKAEAGKNGFVDGVAGAIVIPTQDTTVNTQMNVDVSAPVPTFFMRLFGINAIQVTRTAKATHQLPIPMGSPQNYYGISCLTPVIPTPEWPKPACADAAGSDGASGVAGAGGGGELNSQGFWGVVFSRGGDSRNGDAYSPLVVSSWGSWVSNDPTSNSQGNFDPSGYPYSVLVPADGGAVYLFDPAFCAMGGNGAGGRSGAGDEYTGAGPGASNPGPVTTYFNLYNMNGTPNILSDDVLVVQQVHADPVQSDQLVDGTGAFVWGDPGVSGAADCSADPAHNHWVPLAAGLAAGQYRLQVTTTHVDTTDGGVSELASQPSNVTGAANRFGIEVVGPSLGATQVRVHGGGRMAAYTNLPNGTQAFYLAQIEAGNAGKTVIINLFDPGDVGGGAWLRILSPDGNAYTPLTFSYTSISKATGAAGPSGVNVTCIQTSNPSAAPAGVSIPGDCPQTFNGTGSGFDAYWLTIAVPLSAAYGSTGLTPAGEPGAGWWKIEYTVAGGNDTTTWRVAIRGNPVHLIPS